MNAVGYRRALVPLDGSAVAEAILPYIVRIARPLGLELALLRVIPSLPGATAEGAYRVVLENTERIRQEAEQYLRERADALCAGGLRVLTEVRQGDAATEIVAAAQDCQADLIAMTTHGRSGLSRLLFGSVAEAVLRRALVPVFLMRVTEAELQRRAA